jgi:hypothetical protein
MTNKQFNINLAELPPIKRVTLEGKRHYQLATGESLAYPSVTTVISGCKKTQAGLRAWKKRVGQAEAQRISTQASTRGTSVHQLIEDYCQGLESEGKIMPNAFDMFTRLRNVADEHIDNIRVIEGLMYSEHLRSAGTVDMIAEFDGKLSVIDWKTANKPKTRSMIYNYFKQEAAYAVMFEEMTGIAVPQLVTVITTVCGESQVFVEHRDEWIPGFIELRDQYEAERELQDRTPS